MDAGTAAPSGSESERRTRAHAYFEKGQFQEAAEEFEALAREGSSRVTEDFFNAGTARIALHHHAHAAVYLTRVLADLSLPPHQRAQATALLAQVREKLLPVQVIVVLPRDLKTSVTVRVEVLPVFASDRRPVLERPLLHEPTAKFRRTEVLYLDPGNWRLRVDDPQFLPEALRVTLPTDARKSVILTLREDPRRARRFATGFAVAGGVVAGTGVGLLAGGQVQESRTLALRVEACPDAGVSDQLTGCHAALARAGSLRATGGALIGVGFGGLVAGLTALAKTPRGRRGAWYGELALGAASVAAGSLVAHRGRGISAGVAAQSLMWSDPYYREKSHLGSTELLLGATWAGLGGGLLLGALTGLIADQAGRFQVRDSTSKISIRGSLIPGQTGVVVSGAF